MAFGMKVWVTPLRKAPRPTKVLAEGRSNTKLVVEGHVTSGIDEY